MMLGELTTWIFGLLRIDVSAQADAAVTVLVWSCSGCMCLLVVSPKVVFCEKQYSELTYDE